MFLLTGRELPVANIELTFLTLEGALSGAVEDFAAVDDVGEADVSMVLSFPTYRDHARVGCLLIIMGCPLRWPRKAATRLEFS